MNEEQIMTEKDYEKAYKEALERARAINSGKDVDVEAGTTICEYIFPQLKMNDDEKTRKDLLSFIKAPYVYDVISQDRVDPWIAWLEKQGKSIRIKKGKNYLCTKTHKYAGLEWIEGVKYYSPEDYALVNQGCTCHCPEYSKEEHNNFFKEVEYDGCVEVDNVKPKFIKFNVGDWIACEELNTAKIISFDGDKYEVEFIDGNKGFPHIDYIDRNFHLWSIADAKEGDVLVNGSNIFIFHFINDTRLMGYCHVNVDDGRFYDDMDKNECFCLIDAVVNPATKEQRNLLFQKMKKAGWKWNAEKKELKKNNSYCIENCKGYQETGKCFADGGCDAYHKAEQKSVEDSMSKEKTPDKVKPKFKIGDWIVNNNSGGVYQVTEIREDEYCLWPLYGEIQGYLRIIDVDPYYHLWTIKDANEGNILAGKIDGDNYIFIFKTIKDGWIETYGHYYNAINRFCVPSQLFCRDYQGTFTPATKEQRDLLFTKMKEAGYEFDFEKKELKKTTQKDFVPKEDICKEAKSKLTPFDKKVRDFLFSFYHEVCNGMSLNEMIDGANQLNAMIGNVEQKPTEWSDEDEAYKEFAISAVEDYYDEENPLQKELVDWLKSFKDRLNWKPSKEQMETLEHYMHTLLATKHKEVLFGLYDDLKKL